MQLFALIHHDFIITKCFRFGFTIIFTKIQLKSNIFYAFLPYNYSQKHSFANSYNKVYFFTKTAIANYVDFSPASWEFYSILKLLKLPQIIHYTLCTYHPIFVECHHFAHGTLFAKMYNIYSIVAFKTNIYTFCILAVCFV